MSDTANALMKYVSSRVPWACLPFAYGSRGICHVILKPHPKEMARLILKTMAQKASMPPDKFAELLNPDGEPTMNLMMNMLNKMGTEFPMCSIGPVDDNYQSTTGFVVHYNGTIALDFSEPDFFEKLDQVLDHIVSHDGFSGFSLPPQNAASSD